MLKLYQLWDLSLSRILKIRSKIGFKPAARIREIDQLHEITELNSSYKKIKSARLSISLIFDSSLIIIRNTGQTDAKNVKIIIDDIPIYNYPGIVYEITCNTIPSQSSNIIQACKDVDSFPSEFIEITWDDIDAEEKFYRLSLYN